MRTLAQVPFFICPNCKHRSVDLDGFEGPLDLLLALARTQKVDIAKISVLALADQYLSFIAEAQKLRLELAADYLVMAAWLAFLKSRLLLPREVGEATDVSAEELARRLSFRLMRLEAMRDAAAELMNRMRLGRDVFQRGMPEGTKTIRETAHTATIYDLLHAYADQRRRTIKVGQRPRGIEFTKNGKFVLVAVGDDDKIEVIDVVTQQVVDSLPSGPDPELFTQDAAGKILYVANENDNTVTIIDLETQTRMGDVQVGVEDRKSVV